VLARGIKSVFNEERAERIDARQPVPISRARTTGWFSGRTLASLAASVFLAAIVGYQSMVTIPGLRSSRALPPVVLRAEARGEEQSLQLRRDEPYSLLSIDVNAADPGTPLVYEIAPEKGSVRNRGNAVAPPPGSSLIVVVPHGSLDQNGSWSLVLRNSQGA